ncbi:YigZ family protein [Paraglaciecola aestuariivivens]
MIDKSYYLPKQHWQAELEIKRSKFLAFVAPVTTRQQADDFIKSLRAKHPQANHVCWAYIAGAPDTTLRSMSDDGEPSGTAGMPMLKVLSHSGLGNIVVAVVRYFGGTKLGTGGLQRAYSDAVSLVLSDLPTVIKVVRTQLVLTYDYQFEGVISRLLASFDADNIVCDYAQQIKLTLDIARAEKPNFINQVTNATSGQIQIVEPNKAIVSP